MNINITNSPFNEEQAKQLNELLPTLTPEQKLWLSGYLTASQQAETNESVTSNQIAQQDQQTE
ncbi:sulfite reductase [NADPH] flavoprotein alpha-component, partial [Vibrio vulnificus]